jgi:hypothetical protein
VHARLKQLAAEQGLTLATLYRRFSENYLATDGKMQDAMRKFGPQHSPSLPAREQRRRYRRKQVKQAD